MSIYVANESGAVVDEVGLVGLSRFVLAAMGVDPLAELSFMLYDTVAMEALHVQWMDESGPTDVMAFPMDEYSGAGGTEHPGDGAEPGPALLGDVVICPEVAAAQAIAAGHSTEDEIHLLATHGILHLLGYDHGEPDEQAEMFGKQTELLAAWRDSHTGGAGQR